MTTGDHHDPGHRLSRPGRPVVGRGTRLARYGPRRSSATASGPTSRTGTRRRCFPAEIVPEMGRLGLLGMHLSGYGCPGRSAVEYGLAALELEAGDSGLRTFVSVQGSLAMSAIYKFGTEEQKQRWLPRMAAGELIGCFGLTEPTAGSDPASMTTDGAPGRRRLGHQRRQALDRPGVDRRRRRHLGAHRGRHPRLPRPHRYPGVHRHADRAEAVDARLDPVRHHARPTCGCPPTRSCPGPRACAARSPA